MEIAIIGGGASGLACAIASAKNGIKVTVFERNNRVGKKILVTGNGKCNIGNMNLSEDCYYCDDKNFILSTFGKASVEDTIQFFKGLGLLLKEKNGYLYPNSEQAATVLDALYLEAISLGVEIKTDCYVTGVEIAGNKAKSSNAAKGSKDAKKDQFLLSYTQYIYAEEKKKRVVVDSINSQRSFDKVILSTGGKAAPSTGSDGNGYTLAKSMGHTVTSLVPALCGLKCEGEFWKSIAGVRTIAEVSLFIDKEQVVSDYGELQLTDYGISGIPAFQISRVANMALKSEKTVIAHIDFMPDLSKEQLKIEFEMRHLLLDKRTREQFLNGFFNKKLTILFLKKAGLDIEGSMKVEDFDLIINIVKDFRAKIIGSNGFEQAQVTAGGVPLGEINDNFESRLVKGLYIIGEMLDVDGLCGGYNLQWAWSSGKIAGENVCKC